MRDKLLNIISHKGNCTGVSNCADCPLGVVSIEHKVNTCVIDGSLGFFEEWTEGKYHKALELYTGTYGKDADLMEVLI